MSLTWNNFDSWLSDLPRKRTSQESQPTRQKTVFDYISYDGTSFPDGLNFNKIMNELAFYGKAETGIDLSKKSPYKSASGEHDDIYADGLLNLYSLDGSITGDVYKLYKDPLLNSYSMDKSITGDVYKLYKDPLLNSYGMDRNKSGTGSTLYDHLIAQSFFSDLRTYSGRGYYW